MVRFLRNILETVTTLSSGMWVTIKHMVRAKRGNVTLQYPEERWPRPERHIGFDHSQYNVIRSRLHVVIDDCIGCLKCERACPVDCIKIDTVKAPERGEDIPELGHTGVTSTGTKKALVVTHFTIDMSECCYCNLCTYPCPEDCIFMVGGPNADRYPIDYEFSEFNRQNLIYQFAKTVTPEQKEALVEASKKPKVSS